MRPVHLCLALVVASTAVAFALQPARRVFINGKASGTNAITQSGETYVSLKALREAGAGVEVTADRVSIQFTPPGGRLQVDAVEGVLGEFVSNETWRVKVHSVEPIPNPFTGKGPGFRVRLEVRNISQRNVSMHASGLARVQVVDDKGNTYEVADRTFNGRYQQVVPAGTFTNDLEFGGPNVTDVQADKLLITFTKGGRPAALTPMRIRLQPEK